MSRKETLSVVWGGGGGTERNEWGWGLWNLPGPPTEYAKITD